MKFFLTVIIISLFCLPTFSQWTQTNGPTGGYVGDIATIDNYIFLNAGAGGVYRSENNGDQWNTIHNGLPVRPHCRAISITGSTIYASMDLHGVYKSSDFGRTWTSAGTALQGKTFYSLLADGNDIYAGESEGGFYHSSDGGSTWVKKGNNIGQVRNFVVAGGNLLIGASGKSGIAVVYKSTNKGETLVNLNAPVTSINALAGYDNAIYVVGGQPTAISRDFGATWTTSPIATTGSYALSSIVAQNDQVIIPGGNSTIFISGNEGIDWAAITNLPYAGIVSAANRKGDTIIIGGREGIYISENNGISWQEKNEGLKNLVITHLGATDDVLFAGTGDGIFSSTDQGVTWNKRNNGLADNSGAGFMEGVVIAGIHINPSNTIIATSNGIFKTLDNGLTWDLKHEAQGDTNNNFYVLAGDRENVFTLEYGYQHYSVNEGEDWITRSNPAFQGLGILSASVKGDTVIVLAHDKVLISKDFGLTWESSVVTPGVYMRPNDAIFIKNDLYLATYQGIFKSEDLGKNWEKLNQMTDRSPLSLFYRDNALYSGTTAGIHVSYDKGLTWHALNEGMENIWTGPLVLNSTNAFSGSYGGSVWRNSLDKMNVRPTITGLLQPLELNSALEIPVDLSNLRILDPDDDFPQDFTFVVKPGSNYTVTNNVVKPTDDYNGELHITLVVSDGHYYSKEYVVTIYVITGVEESLASFKIFPNPTSEKINFTMAERFKSISLRDLAGREIAHYENPEGIDETFSIDVSHFPKGIYFIELKGKGKQVQRFLKY